MTDQLRLDSDDEVALVSVYITAAREHAELVSRRAFLTQTLALTLDDWPADSVISLPRPPLQSVTSVVYTDADGDAQTFASDQYVVYPSVSRLVLAEGASWPSILENSIVTVTFVAGYGDESDEVPARYRQAVQLLAAHWFERREAMTEIELYDVPLAFDSLVMTDRAY